LIASGRVPIKTRALAGFLVFSISPIPPEKNYGLVADAEDVGSPKNSGNSCSVFAQATETLVTRETTSCFKARTLGNAFTTLATGQDTGTVSAAGVP
jgi:hypothetical protein